MNPTTKHRSKAEDDGIAVRSEWADGPRTAAWDRLWRIILAGLDPEPTTADGGRPGPGGEHG